MIEFAENLYDVYQLVNGETVGTPERVKTVGEAMVAYRRRHGLKASECVLNRDVRVRLVRKV